MGGAKKNAAHGKDPTSVWVGNVLGTDSLEETREKGGPKKLT